MKVEVAVRSEAPHYALFWTQGTEGAVADITIHRNPVLLSKYTEYLRKTPEEQVAVERVYTGEWFLIQDILGL
jgi:hypothetical protein